MYKLLRSFLFLFDAEKVHGNISARLAKAGESLVALDGKTYTLTDQMTVIADDRAAEGIAGIMGGYGVWLFGHYDQRIPRSCIF